MQNVSEAFTKAMESRPYIAKITLDDGSIIQGDPIKEINFGGGTNDSNAQVTIGGTVAATAEIMLNRNDVTVPLKDRKLRVELGIVLGQQTEWLLMGTYKAITVIQDDDSVTVTAMDPMATKLDTEYRPLKEFDFSKGVDSVDFLAALCARRGVETDLSGLERISLKGFDPIGCTEREIIGMIAALYGRFAIFSRSGVLQLRWYVPVDAKITGDNYYEDGMEIAEYDFVPNWLKCYNETTEETMTLGDPDAEQGIYFECPWMSDDRLEAIWANVQAFGFRPVTELSFLGDPRLDPGDIITLADCGGGVYSVPVMSISHEWDGGIITEITAQGQAKTDAYEGPVKREFKRTMTQIVKRQNEIELSVKSLDGNKIVSMINLSDTTAKIMAANIKLEGLVTANKNFQILTDGSIKAANADISGKITTNEGKIAGWDIDDNSIRFGDLGAQGSMWICRTGTADSPGDYGQVGIAGTDAAKTGWSFTIGNSFGVDRAGFLYATGAHITGKIDATSGSISRFNIDKTGITGVAYVKGSTTATHINVGFCPGSIGTGNYYERIDNREVISLFIGVERITEPSEHNGNGTVFANFMVNQYGDLFATNAELVNAEFSNATAKKITAEDILLKYEQESMTVVINLRTEIESLRRRIAALGG